MTLVSPARADLQNPRQAFLRNSIGGLFLHWGERTSPQHTSCTQWETDVTNGGWDPNYWVNEAKKLHTQYIVLATFHSRLGYARPYPSKIPGSCATKRDFLGELINAADAQGLKVINYMTDDPQWHNQGLTSGDWLNSSAFSSYVGHSVDLTTRDGFGEFSYLQFFEQMQRYPKLAGFWIDNDNAYWESHNLYGQIQQQRPDMTLSNNNEDTPIMDMISNEQKTGMTPAYDYPQAVYTAAPRLIEACFKLPTTGNWWYDGNNSTVDYKVTLGRLITNAGSSVKALMAETAQVNGKFPSNQATFNNFTDTYLDPIWESLNGTEGGGYMYGGLKPGFWNNGAHGVTTISKTNPNQHYIHVVTAPSGSTLQVRDNGYKISSVTNLRTGAAVSFTQANGTLTLSGISSWDQYDTVFKVISSGREGIYSGVTVSASSSTSGHGGSAAGDGDYLTYWDSNAAEPASLTFDLGSAKKVQYIGFNQREDSTVYPSTDSARIAGYSVYLSNDGSTWGSAVKTGTVPNARGVQFIDLSGQTARYVRLTKTGHHGISRWRVDEAWVGGAYAAAGGPVEPPPGRYEAEDATISQGVLETTHTGFSGTGYVNGDNVAGSYLEWNVNAASAGTATVKLRYSNGTTTNRPSAISVNGTTVFASRDYNSTTNWDTWATDTFTVPVNAGANTIRATATTANGNPNIDYIDVDVTPSGGTPTDYQAEDATISQGVVANNHLNFTGTGFVDYTNITGSYVEFTVNAASAGSTPLVIRYANGTTVGRPMDISVNGTVVASNVPFNPTTDWDTWVTSTQSVPLNAGSNTIRLTATTANGGPNLDKITVG
ncbi:carbohydrate-binding protein [Planotetraspora sp. A-T 1434]|uniref:carbohydrate-binding protein n=1 Tax=Planotetraspora sp. A-T 1434 TaxID=2979219 RepID=UPI0021C0E708|nr:carbohydrate-binding protein [Planotetraspora sp. A-T 1434]MCT9930267.1 carbohydrate-binding protein [Planotetraspora sp. A-T 1434]